MQVATSSHIFWTKENYMGKFNRKGKAKKEHDFVALQWDIKYANNVPPEIAALVEVGIQQT